MNKTRRDEVPGKIPVKDPEEKGFTLVEIMIEVAIIGLLAAMAIPHFGASRDTAYRQICISNLRLIEGAVQQWAMHKR